METIAVYWESRIKTYGVDHATGLSLIELTLNAEKIETLASAILDPENAPVRPYFILGQYAGKQDVRTFILVSTEWEKKLVISVRRISDPDLEKSIRITAPVGLLYFQGPHYGDRFGIAHSVFGSLSKKNISILAAGFSASSIYLVVHERMLTEARDTLLETFETPNTLHGEE